MFSKSSFIFNEYIPVKLSLGRSTVKLNERSGMLALEHKKWEFIWNTSIARNARSTYFRLSTLKLLGPLTSKFLKTAWNSGPLFMCTESSANGSIAGVWKPSPRSPWAKRGRSFSAAALMHGSGSGRFREHDSIVEATKCKIKNYNRWIINCEIKEDFKVTSCVIPRA